MRIYDFPQKSPEWWRVRRSIPTASEFDRILQPSKGGPSSSQGPYIDELIAESIDQLYSEQPDDGYVSRAMANGTENEPAARSWYAFEKNVDVREVGFCLSSCGRYGASPDGLIGNDGLLEVKCPILKTHIKYIREGKLPDIYKCQVHGELLVTGRAWADFVSYSPNDELDSLVVRVYPDDFTKKLAEELERFLETYAKTLAKLGRHIQRPIDSVLPVAEFK